MPNECPDKELRKCRTCGRLKLRIRGKRRNSGGYGYIGENGRAWEGSNCPACHVVKTKFSTRNRRGKQGRFDRPPPHEQKAIWAERLVASFFRGHKYVPTLSECRGPDIILEKNDTILTCEVKIATKMKGSKSWACAKVRKDRKKDDLIAIVFDSGEFFVEPMEVHLSKCSPHGRRYVTDEANFFGVKY